MISNYTILIDTWDKDLIAQVQKLIIDGWQPLGGVSRSGLHPHESKFSQAMVKWSGEAL